MRIALGALAAYTALSFLSILWAAVPGDAWEGANRTLLYLLVFALFACWRQRGASAALLLGAWTLALIALAAFTALHVNAAAGASLQALLPGGRLVYPSGYANANAAQWLMAFWPALLLARSERLPWGVRGLLAGGAVLLAEVALLSQSRGSLYATPVMLVLVFALLPGRTRTFAVLVPVAAGIGAAAPAVLRVGDDLKNGAVTTAAVHSATVATFAAAVAVGLVVALGAAVETRRSVLAGCSQTDAHRRPRGRDRHAGGGARGRPGRRRATRSRGSGDGWDSFKGGYGANSTTGNRLLSGLGSNRYDFYRVALDEFLAHPLVGIGADNFQQQYLAHGRSEETPHYPHSVELRTLAQTGLVGALLALVGLGAALLAAARALRSSDPLVRSVTGAALAGFAYWVGPRLFRLVLGVRGAGSPGVCAARPRLRARAGAGRRPAPAVRRRDGAVRSAAGAWPCVAGRARGARRRGLAGRSMVEPARGPERGAHLDERAADGLCAPAGRRPPEPAQRRGRSGRGQHRPALRRTGPRRSRVLARRSREPPATRTRRSSGERSPRPGANARPRSGSSSGLCGWTHGNRSPGRPCGWCARGAASTSTNSTARSSSKLSSSHEILELILANGERLARHGSQPPVACARILVDSSMTSLYVQVSWRSGGQGRR